MTSGDTKFIYWTAASLDGFIADEHNSLSWLFDVPHADGESPRQNAFFDGVGAMVEGSTTYEWVLEHEQLLEQPERWQHWFEDRPQFVFTSRELPVPAGADVRFLRGDVRAALAEIVAAAGGRNVWLMGGGALVGAFDAAGALDEIVLSIAPVTLGAGAPLIAGRIESDRLRLLSAEAEGQFIAARYEVRRSGDQPR